MVCLSQNANTLLRTCFSCTMGLSHDDRNSSRAARVLYLLYVFALGKKIVANNCEMVAPRCAGSLRQLILSSIFLAAAVCLNPNFARLSSLTNAIFHDAD